MKSMGPRRPKTIDPLNLWRLYLGTDPSPLAQDDGLVWGSPTLRVRPIPEWRNLSCY